MAETAEEKQKVAELFREYLETRSEDLRNELAEKHLYLAEILARKYAGRGVDYEDLYQVASYALLLAIERYDPDKGVQFTSFATPTIIGEIKKYFRDTAWSLKVPRRLKEIAMRIPQAKEKLIEELGHVPTVPELAKELDVPEDEILEALEGSRAYTTYSLEQEAEASAEAGDSPIFEKYLGTEEKGYDDFETSSVVRNVMAELSDTEKDIMRKRFLQEMTQREVAEALGLSQMTVSRIEKAMRAKFRAEYNR